MKITTKEELYNSQTFNFCFQPGDGTCYDIVMCDDPHGGYLIIWPNYVTYRYFPTEHGEKGEIKHLHGQKNDYTTRAIFNFLESL